MNQESKRFVEVTAIQFQCLFQCSTQFIAGPTALHGTLNTYFLISFWRKPYINGFSSEFNMAQVRVKGSDISNRAFTFKFLVCYRKPFAR